ncbi:MAG TPA: type II secretion system protein GspC [Kofleriaceae bacterium]|nr:type II secretion system protein GspC [Kofleriaceae bacterium]
MQDLIKRYFWVLGGAVVMVCSVFAAKATSHILEAKFLGDSDHAPRVIPMMQAPVAVQQTRSKDGAGLVTRDIFCSECTPAVTVASTNPNDIQTTTLPLVLLATNVAPKPENSYATIVNTENQRQGSFGVGDAIPGATGKLKEIHYKYVDFENGGHIERLVLAGQPPPVAAPVAAAPAPQGEGDELQAAIDSGIKKIDDNTYEIDKGLVEKILANPMGVAKGARVVPAVQNGKPNGFKLYAIRPSSVYAKIGLTNGDTLSAINGMELTTADKALEVYTKLREATSLEVEIQRRGKPMTLKYTIR